MRNNARFELDERWWKKEAPDKVGSAYKKFSDELKSYLNAHDFLSVEDGDDQLDPYDLKEIENLKKQINGLLRLNKAAAKECADAAGDEKDKKKAEDLKYTAEVLEKPLEKAISDRLKEYSDLKGDPNEEPMVSPEAHGKYLKKLLPKVKRKPHNFAFALVGSDPSENRLMLHHKRAGRTLKQALKADTGASKFVWGQAAGGGTTDGEVSGTTLILDLEGGKVPNIARRLRLVLKEHGISMFNKVIIRQEGQEVDGSTEDEPDVALAPLSEIPDDEDEDTGDQVSAPETASAAPPPPPPPPEAPKEPTPEELAAKAVRVRDLKLEQVWKNMRADTAPVLERAISLNHPKSDMLQKLWGFAIKAVDNAKYADGIKAAQQVQKMLAGFEPPPETKEAEYWRKKEKLKKEMAALLAEGKGQPGFMRAALGTAVMEQQSGNWEDALKALAVMARIIKDGAKMEALVESVPKDPAAQAKYADELRRTVDGMAPDLEAASEMSPKFARDVDRFVDGFYQALDSAPDSPKTDGKDGKKETGGSYKFEDAFYYLMRLERLLKDAKKAGLKADKARKRFDALLMEAQAKLADLGEVAGRQGLSRYFADAKAARAEMAYALKKKDIYAALAKCETWMMAIEAIEDAAAEQPETV